MNEIIDRVLGELRSAWRFRWFGFAAAAVVAMASWSYVLSLPDQYEATASVFVDTRTALKPVLEGLIVEDDIMSQLGYVRQSILSDQHLEKIAIDSGVVQLGDVDLRRKQQLMAALASQVVIQASKANADAYVSSGTIYSFAYPSLDPQRAVKVTQTVMDTFISETLGGKQESTVATQQFLVDQIKDYDAKLKEAEDRLAEFKKRNLGLMPTDGGDYFSQLQAEIDAGRQAQGDLDVAVMRKTELTRQLRGESVITSSTIAATQTGPGSDTASRIREAQGRLDDLLLRFTDRHPDVIEARNSVEELRKRRELEVESLRRGDSGAAAATGLSNNPVYQSIQLQLNQVDVEIASLRGKIAQHNAKAAELRKLLDTAPKVEAEYAQLNRDYDINKSQHSALLASLEKARLGEQADNAGGMRFQVVQPPVARLASASMHRSLLLVGGLGAALVAGAALAFLLHLMRPVIVSVRDLQELTDMPVIGLVSAAFPGQLRAQARWSSIRFGAALGLLVAVFAIVLLVNSRGFRLGEAASGAGLS